jgi:hypothetical protein
MSACLSTVDGVTRVKPRAAASGAIFGTSAAALFAMSGVTRKVTRSLAAIFFGFLPIRPSSALGIVARLPGV